jgi:hypothetical protein
MQESGVRMEKMAYIETYKWRKNNIGSNLKK